MRYGRLKFYSWSLCLTLLLGGAGRGQGDDAGKTAATEAASPAPPVRKVAVPDAAAQAEAAKLVNDVYKDDFTKAQSVGDRVALARRLLQTATETKDDPAGRFVMLTRACDMAADAGDIAIAMSAVGQIGDSYWIDDAGEKTDVLTRLSKSVRSVGQGHEFLQHLGVTINQAIALDRYDLADRLCSLSDAMAHRFADAGFARLAALRLRETREIEAAWTQVQKPLATLAQQPDNPDANSKVGRFLCLYKGQWAKGLPLLAAGSDGPARSVAKRDLAGAATPEAQMALGDSWWELSDKEQGLVQQDLQWRASFWYRQALPNLTGLAKVKVDKRLSDFDSALSKAANGDTWIDLLASASPALLKPTGPVSITTAGVVMGPDDAILATTEPITVPFQVQLVAKTDSTNIRVCYSKCAIILNWEVRLDELRISDPADGHPVSFKGKGKVTANEWQNISLTFSEHAVEVIVNGESRGKIDGKYQGLKDVLQIQNYAGATVQIQVLRVAPLK